MHLPEQAVGTGEFGALGGALGVRVNQAQGKVAEYESHPRSEVLLHEIDDWMRGSAERTFIVAVLDQRDRRACRTPDMVMRRDWSLLAHARFPVGWFPVPTVALGRRECHRRPD